MASYKLELIIGGVTVRTITRQHPTPSKDVTNLSFGVKIPMLKDDTIKVKLTVIDGGKEYNVKSGSLNIEKMREF